MDLELEQGTVEREGESIYWEFVTNGAEDTRPVVVLTHGAGGTHAVWYQQIPALGAQFRVLTWDSRGFGNSTNINETPTAAAAAADLTVVLDHLAVDRAHLIGQSMGGWHITAFALAHPGRVLSLTYADTVGGLWTDELRQAMVDFQKKGGLAGGGPTIVGTHRALWSGTAERDPALAFLYQALGSFHSPPLAAIGKVLGADAIEHSAISALGVPVLFLAGTHDEIFPAPALRNSCALVDGARYVEIPAAGHSPYFEQPAAWNDAVLQFLISVG
ncbi:MAG: 3-oxoadipate enol-lactonase [Candidatus Poriferisodalaceae bacterium]|jgi:3-oxoadipate enol-lactonase